MIDLELFSFKLCKGVLNEEFFMIELATLCCFIEMVPPPLTD
jgi:hypothetical protein